MRANTGIRDRGSSMRSHRWFTPWLLLGPAVAWVLVFALWPFLNTVFLSFTDARPLRTPEFVGGANYERMFGDEMFWNALTTCLIYVVVCVPLLTILPLLLALLVQKKLPGISFFRTTFYFPVIASVVVVALIWTWLFDSRGIINQTLEFLGLIDKPMAFLVDRWLLLGCAILLTVWKGLGYYMVVYLAALGNVGKELHEAAMLDGANGAKRLLYVTLPMIRQTITTTLMLITLQTLSVFTLIWVMTAGGPGNDSTTLPIYAFKEAFRFGNIGYGTAIATVMLVVGAIFSVVYIRALRAPKERVA